ncbi:hypothetical protein AXG93_1976s1550 [Marchantia polymorpha subsp. ruderalis]|uniref:Uncharacterized protein n=1 Tax=Marchantia polymorpha subsp. ruderalis TaxID=1480154 RepID=A0A176VDE6_MARPO|nr:hypothetical protein AXG93_1976s1550 [Marchantia polymorpha subsp. ruderalis]
MRQAFVASAIGGSAFTARAFGPSAFGGGEMAEGYTSAATPSSLVPSSLVHSAEKRAAIGKNSMAKSVPLRMVPLRVPQIRLRAFQDELTAVKLDFLLWGWNWVCPAMVREWLREKDWNSRVYQSHPERWQISDWEQVLGRCAGPEGDLLFDIESVQLSKEEELTFDRRSRKNRYKIRDYVDRKRRNVAVAILQILHPHSTSYMSS